MKTKITESEWKIMQVLWNCGKLSLSDITTALEGQNWSYSTIKTLLKRLVDKGYVKADKSEQKHFMYEACVDESVCKEQEAKDLLDGLFQGSVSTLVSALVKPKKMSDRDYQELMNLIDKMEH